MCHMCQVVCCPLGIQTAVNTIKHHSHLSDKSFEVPEDPLIFQFIVFAELQFF